MPRGLLGLINKTPGMGLLRGGALWRFVKDFTTLPDGAISDAMVGATWTISGGKLLNTPALGVDLLGAGAPTYKNGNCETGDPPTDWHADGDSGIAAAADQRTGGTGTQSINVTRSATKGGAYETTWSGQIGWHKLSGWIKNIDATEVDFGASTDLASVLNSWVKKQYTQLFPTSTPITLYVTSQGAVGQQVRADDFMINKLTEGSLFRTLETHLSDIGIVSPPLSNVSVPNVKSGIVLCLDNTTTPTQYVVIYQYLLSGIYTYVEVYQFTGGTTYTSLLAATLIAPATNKFLSVKKVGTKLQVFYGTTKYTTQVGTDLTIDATVALNTKHGLFSTDEQNLFNGVLTIEKPPSF